MLNNKGFDLWADDYDKCVGLSDDNGTYPFAGYKEILNNIYNYVLNSSAKIVLDIGFGTGTLTSKLYDQGCVIYGQDFSEKMIELAQKKMPDAELFLGDFSKGLVKQLTEKRYDAIIATYSLHHLTDLQKVEFIKTLIPLLNNNGTVYIGDVAFETRAELENCMTHAGDEWDEDEMYFIFDELKKSFPEIEFEKISDCAGLFVLHK